MSDETTKVLIQQLPQILTAAGVLITAIGTIVLGIVNYRRTGDAIKQSTANAKAIESLANEKT